MDKIPIETLGIVIMNNYDTNYIYNFKQRIFIPNATLNTWMQREKLTVPNNLALVHIIYASCVVNTANKVLTDIGEAIHYFISKCHEKHKENTQ